MASNCDRKMSKELSTLRTKSAADDRKIFKLTDEVRLLKKKKLEADEKLEKHKKVHLQRIEVLHNGHSKQLKEIHKRRGFNIADYEKEIKEKEAEIETLRSRIKESQARIEDLEQQITRIHIEKNQSNITIRGERRKKRKQQITRLHIERNQPLMIIKEDAEYEELQSKCEQLEQKLMVSENEKDVLKSTKDDQQKKLIDSEIQLKAKDDRHAELQCDMQLLQNKLDESQSKNEEMERKLVGSENGKNELILTIADLSQKNELLNQTSKEMQSTIDDQEKKLIDYEAQFKAKEDETTKLQNDKQMLQNDYKELESKNAELEREKNELSSVAAILTQNNENLSQTIKEDATNAEVQLKTKDDIVAALQNELDNVKSKYESQPKNAEMEQKISICERERDALKSKVADLTQKNAILYQTIKDERRKLNKYAVQVKAKDDSIDKLQNQLVNVKNDKQMLQNKFDQLILASKDHETKLTKLRNEMKTMKSSNTALQTELDTVKKSKDESQNYIEHLESEKNKLEECLNDGNRIVSMKDVKNNPNLNITSFYDRHANIDYNWLNEKILILRSLVLDPFGIWEADNRLLKIENATFSLLLVGKFSCNSKNKSEASNLLKYVIRCNLTMLNLYHQTITLSEFMKLTSSQTLEHLMLYKTTVLNEKCVAMGYQQLRELLPLICHVTF